MAEIKLGSLVYRRNNLVALKLEGVGAMSRQEVERLDKYIARLNYQIERLREREGKK